MQKKNFILIALLLFPSFLSADYYEVLNKGLTTIDPTFTKRYSYPLTAESSQETINAACNRQQNFIIQELKKAKIGSQAREQLLADQTEIKSACSVLSSLKSRQEYAKSREEIELKKKEDLELEAAKRIGGKVFEEKQREIQERRRLREKEKRFVRPSPDDPNYIPGMRGFLTYTFQERKEEVGIKLVDLTGDFLSKIDIPGAAFKVFNNDLVLRDLRFLRAPIGYDIATGLGFTGTTQFNKFSVQVTVYIVRDREKKTQYSLSIQLPASYKISDMFPKFKKVDLLSLPQAEFIASTFNYIDNTAGFSVEKGFNFVARLNLEGPLRALGELRKKAQQFDAIAFDIEKPIYLHGLIASASAVKLNAGIPLRFGIDFTKVKHVPKEFAQIINKITTDDMVVGVAVTPIEHVLNAKSGIRLYLGTQPEPFRIQAFGGIDVTSGKINFGGKLPDMLELRFIALGDVTMEMYIDPAVESVLAFFGIPISGLAFGGRIDLGKPGEERVSLNARGKLSLEAKKAADFMFEVEGKNLDFAEILSLLSKMAAKSGLKSVVIPADKLPVMKVERAYGKFAPWDTMIGNELIPAGFQLTLDAQLFDKIFGFDVEIRHKDLIFSGSGYMSEIVFRDKNRVIFKFSGPGPDGSYGTPDDGPTISCFVDAKRPLMSTFRMATILDVPAIGLKQRVELVVFDTQFRADFETDYLGFTTIFGVNIAPRNWKNMAMTFGFKGDFQKFLATYGVPALQSLKNEATTKLNEVNAKIGELTGELEKLKQQQTQIQQSGIRVTQQEIDKTRATINRINAKIKAINTKCAKASPAKKGMVCTPELAVQGAALSAQETYLNVLLKPGKEVIKGAETVLNKINEVIQKVTTSLSESQKVQVAVQKAIDGLSKVIIGSVEVFEVTEAIGTISMADLSLGKLPLLTSLKANVNIPGIPKARVQLSQVQFDFKNPKRSAADIAKKLVAGIKIG